MTVVAGALLLAAYAALFPIVLPLGPEPADYLQMVSDAWWRPLAATALAGILLLLVGLDAVAAAVDGTRLSAWAGLMLLKVALVLQASKVVGQLLFEPSIASHPESAFLLRDAVMLSDPAVVAFRLVSSITLLFGAAMFGAALYRSGAFPKSAVAMIGGGALIYVAGFFVSVFIAVAGVIMLAIGCVLVGVRLWDLSEGS